MNDGMKKSVCLISISVLFFPLICFAGEMDLTLDEAVTIALRDNRAVMLKTRDVEKAKSVIAEAHAALFPALNVSAGWSDTMGYYAKDSGAYSAAAGVKQLIYKGGKVMSAVKAGEDSYTAAEAALDRTKQETVYYVKQAYYALMLAGRFSDLNKTVLDNTGEHSAYIRARYEAGQASESDLLKMEASLKSVKQAYDSSVSQVESAQAVLRDILFIDPEVKIATDAKFEFEPKEAAYDKAFTEALKSRPEIRQFEAQRNAAQKKVEMAKADGRPSVYASWDYYSRSTVPAATQKNWNDYNVVGVTLSWPVFDGWLTRAKVDQAIADLREAELLKEKSRMDIALDVKTAYLALTDALEKIEAAAAGVSEFKDNYEVTLKKYAGGIASKLDVSDSKTGYSVALFNMDQAIYDYKLAQAKFELATGGSI